MGPEKKTVETLWKRHAALANRLGATGLLLQGTILTRSIRREDPDCPGRQKTYGPYYQWTRKVAGKTVNVNLTARQARDFQKAMDRNRRLETLLDDLRKLSLEILEATTPSVPKRTRRKPGKQALC